MLDFDSLRHFVSVARLQSLARAADELGLTPSAVSKSIRRLETTLKTRLFDRSARALKLNAEGQHLVERARELLAQAEKLEVDFIGRDHRLRCRISGPASLLLRFGPTLSSRLLRRYARASVVFAELGEVQALEAVTRGDCEFALVTRAALSNPDPRLASHPLGHTEFKVGIGAHHPLLGKDGRVRSIAVERVIAQDFVAPLTPAFVGLNAQLSTDGWRDDVFPRSIRFRSDDLLLVKRLLDARQALAYLPEFLIAELGLRKLSVSGCAYRCEQELLLVHRPASATGWMNWLIDRATAIG